MSRGRLKRPREPAPSECCGSGCTRCVWDVYFDDLEKYEESIRDLDEQDIGSDNNLPNESQFFSGIENINFHDYIGSIIVKFVDPPINDEFYISPSLAVSKILGRFSLISDVHMISNSISSSTNSDNANTDNNLKDEQAIQVFNIILDNQNESNKIEAPVLPLPGDVLEIFVPNDNDLSNSGYLGEVEILCNRLEVDPNQWCEIHRSPFVSPNNFPPWLPSNSKMQIRTLFSYFIDISSCSYLFHPTFFQTLLRFAKMSKKSLNNSISENNKSTFELLETCASKEIAPFIYKKIINNGKPLCYPKLIDILNIFPFVKLPIERLLEVSAPLRPRKFSVVHHTSKKSSKGEELNSVQLCLRRVDVVNIKNNDLNFKKDDPAYVLAELLHNVALNRFSSNEKLRYFFTGHISYPLCNFRMRPYSLPIYAGTKLFGTSSFAKGLKKAIIPFTGINKEVTTSSSLILVGAGTGISPLMSFINEISSYHKNISESWLKKPNCWVVYGARNLKELIFHKQLEEALKLNIISRYDVAISRSNEGIYPKYVTDIFDSNAEEIRSTLLENNGQMFACGPVAVMKSIRERLMNNILASNDDDDDSIREQRILSLEKKGQLMFDIWSTVSIFE